MGLRAGLGTAGVLQPWTGDCPSPWSAGSERSPLGEGAPVALSVGSFSLETSRCWVPTGPGTGPTGGQPGRPSRGCTSRVIPSSLVCFLSSRFLVTISEWFCLFHTGNGPLFETSPSLSSADALGTGPGWTRLCPLQTLFLESQRLFRVWEPLPTQGPQTSPPLASDLGQPRLPQLRSPHL